MKSLRFLSIVTIIALVLVLLPDQGEEASADSQFLGNIWGSATEPLNFGLYWNQVTPENAGKWVQVEGSRDQMNWNTLDAIYDYAKDNDMPFREHNFGGIRRGNLAGYVASHKMSRGRRWKSGYRLFARGTRI
jgi:endo-1,4-beta-xylanase